MTCVVPAHAGVILYALTMLGSVIRGSRTRGGDPDSDREWRNCFVWFPHTRG